MADDPRPPIPASLADRPVVGGIAQAWVNAELAGGGTDFRSPNHGRYSRAWVNCLCQSCGNPTGPRAVLVCGPRQILNGRYDEPPTCPPCAVYASQACPMVSGRSVTYADRPLLVEGPRGARCPDPVCGCGGHVEHDPEHSASQRGRPALSWYACWVPANRWDLTGHYIRCPCPDPRCREQRLTINGAQLHGDPLKVILIAEPGAGRIWRTLTLPEAREHAAAAIAKAGVAL